MKTFVVSLGGSIIVPDEIDIEFLKEFRTLIISEIKNGNKFIIVAGGGKTCRKYQEGLTAVIGPNQKALDWIGISSTHLNAQLVKAIFNSKDVYPKVIVNPTEKIEFKESILIAGGWKPGFSSDMDAVILAEQFGAKTVINLSNINYVYTADPRINLHAKPLPKLSWDKFFELVGEDWKPGMNAPFDPIASKKAKELGLEVVITKGTDLENLKLIFEDKEFIGTIIN